MQSTLSCKPLSDLYPKFKIIKYFQVRLHYLGLEPKTWKDLVKLSRNDKYYNEDIFFLTRFLTLILATITSSTSEMCVLWNHYPLYLYTIPRLPIYVFSNYRICPKSAPLNRLWSIPSPINTCVGSKEPIEVDVWWAAKMRHPVNGAGKWHSSIHSTNIYVEEPWLAHSGF